jgi:flagellar hook-associated protein 3 FlgL
MNIINKHVNQLEQVDPLEAQTRITTLQTQLEMAYALTSRAEKLSLLNYI